MDCKRALSETDGDLKLAEEYLRKKGIAGADKKSGRATKEGVIAAAVQDGGRVACSRRSTARRISSPRTSEFRQFVDAVTGKLVQDPGADLEIRPRRDGREDR